MEYTDIVNEHGGYWNHNDLLDFYYLVNPYFPTKKMMRDFNKVSKSLIINYPSCQRVVSELASKIYNVSENNIAVGNGASELIYFMCKRLSGVTGIIYPSFNEYKARLSNYIEFNSTDYTSGDIIDFFRGKINNIIIVNPQMHTGRYLNKDEMDRIISWCREENINLIIDESFIDFSDESLAFDMTRVFDYDKLFIIKSVSKSFGVPGLRLGVLASSDERFIDELKTELPIWNISSFAQYFLEIILNHKEDFMLSLKKLSKERKRFKNRLSEISEFVVNESGANYFKVDLKSIDSCKLCEIALDNGIILRDLKNRFKTNSIRVSIRDRKDNNKFIKILKSVLSGLK